MFSNFWGPGAPRGMVLMPRGGPGACETLVIWPNPKVDENVKNRDFQSLKIRIRVLRYAILPIIWMSKGLLRDL